MNRHELACAWYCVTEVLNARRLHCQPIPAWLRKYHDNLAAQRATMSADGHETCSPTTDPHTIGVMDVAKLLNVTTRHVRRVARTDANLGAQLVSGTWQFQRDTVEQYAAQKGTKR